jgi:pimeloyl-ACP methyl ester carboxylesterase
MTRRFRWIRRILYTVAAVPIIVLLVLSGFRFAASLRESRSARDAAPAGGRFVKAADVEIYLQEAGDPKGVPVVFIHGTGAWSETWRDSMNALAAAGFRSVALDLPPFGFSQKPENGAYSLDAQAKRIVGVLDALEAEQAILVGHSFGGGPTVEAALVHTARVKALVLVDAALGLDAPSADTSALQRVVLGVTPLRNAVTAATITNPMFTRTFLRMFLFNKDAATGARVAIYQRPFVVNGSTQAVSAWLPSFLSSTQIAKSLDPTSYASLTMPVSLIWGAQDTVTPLGQAEHLKGLMPHAELSVLNGIGHIPQVEDPARFNETLVNFLRSHK